MAFEFSKETHKWCPQCAANIRKDAEWCKYCLKNIGSKFFCQQKTPPSFIVMFAMSWLPGYDELTMNISPGFRERFQSVHDEAVKEYIATTPNYEQLRRDKRVNPPCPNDPPEIETYGLLQDLLLSLRACGDDMHALCGEPRMVLLGFTPELIADEAERRLQEEERGNICKFCCEYVFPEEDCRFCKSNGVDAPTPPSLLVSFVKPPDLGLLSAIILWEAAKRQRESLSQVDAEMLERYCISAESISREIERQAINPDAVPMSQWRTRMLELNIESSRSVGECHLEDILSLGASCEWARKYDETVLVLHHGLSLVGDYPTLKLYKQRLLDALGHHYLLLNDNENHQKYSGIATAMMNSMLTGPQKKIFEESRKRSQEFFSEQGERFEKGPQDLRGELEKSEERIKKIIDEQSQLEEFTESDQVSKMIAKTRSAMSKILDRMSNDARSQIEAAEAKDAGDYRKAAELYKEAISRISNDPNEVPVHASLLCSLAEVQKLDGLIDVAEDSYKQAISVGEEVASLNEGREYSPISIACHAYAKFLIEIQRYEDAEKNLIRAMDMEEKSMRMFDMEFQRKAATVSENEVIIRETLAVLMQRTGRKSEAERLLEEAADLKFKCEEQERRRKAKRQQL